MMKVLRGELETGVGLGELIREEGGRMIEVLELDFEERKEFF